MATPLSQRRPRFFPNINMSYSVKEDNIWSSYQVSDRGSLDISGRSIVFNGQSCSVHILNAHNINLVKANFRWKDYILVILFLASILLVVLLASFYFGISDIMDFYYYIMSIVIGGMIVYSVFAVLFYTFDVWLMIAYFDENDIRKSIYFSQWGRFGVFSNKTRSLFNEIVLQK